MSVLFLTFTLSAPRGNDTDRSYSGEPLLFRDYHKTVGTSSYWDDVVRRVADRPYLDPAFARQRKTMHLALLAAWVPILEHLSVLKTDLFEEATGNDQFLFDVNRHCRHRIGVDFSAEVVSRAWHRSKASGATNLSCVVADVRQMPLKDGSVDVIISNSTLDHFVTKHEVFTGLSELKRILKRGGQLIITLDNPWNPFYPALKLLSALHITPYYLGKSLTRKQLIAALQEQGFLVDDVQALSHHPRILMLGYTHIVRKFLPRSADRHLDNVLAMFDRLKQSKIRFATAAFIAIKATRIA